MNKQVEQIKAEIERLINQLNVEKSNSKHPFIQISINDRLATLEEVLDIINSVQEEDITKDAIPAKVVNDENTGCVIDCEYGCLYLPSHAYDFTDKLKIISVREN